MRTDVVLIMLFIFTFVFAVTVDVSRGEATCVESSKVKSILELKYRDADILLENGKIITVNQASLKIGDDYCSKWKW